MTTAIITRCGHCGTTQEDEWTRVRDWRVEFLCRACVALFDWRDYFFDPCANFYTRLT